MNQMEIFKNPEFGSIRVIEENGKYLFCGTDVAAALGYSNSRDAIIRHCRYVVKRDAPHPQSPDRKISMTFIPEGDLYRLIVHSKLPSAEQGLSHKRDALGGSYFPGGSDEALLRLVG